MGRVKFYSANDLMYGYNLRKSEKVIQEYEEGKEVNDINDIIELYNVKKYFDNKIYFSEWESEKIERYEALIKLSFGMIAKFIRSINEGNFESYYCAVDTDYINDYWELIDRFKVYERISKEFFKEFIIKFNVPIYNLLNHKNIVNYYGEIIREFLLIDPSSPEILIDHFEMEHVSERDPIYFPKELSTLDKERIIINYIESNNPNLNYLKLISNIQSSKDKLKISPKTLLKAKRKAEELEAELFQQYSGMLMETSVLFTSSQEEEFKVKIENSSVTVTYSKEWIEENKDYPTLLNNFIYLFEFVDFQMRSTHVSKLSNLSVIERYLLTSSKNAYKKGVAFDQMNSLSLLQLTGYYKVLFSIGIRLEEVIEWFFKHYLSSEFNAQNFKITMPSSSSTILEKCTNIMPAMESVLKQFTLFVEDGYIDFELLEIRSEHLIYKNIPSLIEKKYVYGCGEEFKTATFLLFSDQSGLGYYGKSKKSYGSFYELLCNERLKRSEYPKYNHSRINWLIEHNYLSVDKEEYICISNKSLIIILKDLYFNEVISYWNYPLIGRKIIDELEKKNIIEFESSLFSRPEQDYINYFLNKSKFNNGLDLRNKYSHTQPFIEEDKQMHQQNYMIFLRIFILLVIKINDDFCIFEEIKVREEK